MSKLGKMLIAAVKEGIAIARGEADPASFQVHSKVSMSSKTTEYSTMKIIQICYAKLETREDDEREPVLLALTDNGDVWYRTALHDECEWKGIAVTPGIQEGLRARGREREAEARHLAKHGGEAAE